MLGLELSADWRAVEIEGGKKERKRLVVEGLELQLILTLPSSITVYHRRLLPTIPCPMTELWQPGGVLQPGASRFRHACPFPLSKQEHMDVKSSRAGSVLPLSTAFTPFN